MNPPRATTTGRAARTATILLSVFTLACQGREPARTAEPGKGSRTPQQAAVAGPKVLFLGDSLSAGYGLPKAEAFPAILGELLGDQGLPIQVINGGVSGDTSAAGLQRLDWMMRGRPDIVVLELGANDGMRGLPLEQTEENLRALVSGCRERGAAVLLCGMRLPPNYGPDRAERFRSMFPRLAGELDVPLVPFLLEGVAGDRELNLPDGIHPNTEGQQLLAATVLPYLRELVERQGQS